MTTFISYQPRRGAPVFMANDISTSGPVGSADCALWPQSRRARERSKLNVGADLLRRLGAAHPDEATPESSTIPETPQAPEVDSIEECDEGDAYVDDSELPSLDELLCQARQGSGTSVGLDLKSTTTSEQLEFIDRRDVCSGTGSETGTFPCIDAARGMFSGANRDNPIVLDESDDEDERDNQCGATAPCRDDSNLDTASSVNRRNSSPLTIIPSVTDGAHGTPSSPGDHTLQHSADGGEGRKMHENNRSLRESGSANEEPAGGSEVQEIPASAGHIHDIFADYEQQRFGMKRPNQQAQRQRTTQYPSTRDDSDQTVVSSSFAKQSVYGDGSQTSSTRDVGIEEHTRLAGTDSRLSCSPAANTADEPASQSRQDSEEQPPSLDGVGSNCTTHATVFQESSIVDNTPLIPHITTNITTRSGAVLSSRNPSTRKRPHQSSESILSPDDSVSKRPRRVTRESWKAREARELSEAKQAVAPSRSCSRRRPRAPKRVPQARLACDGNEKNNQIADVEDVFLAEDGSIQCVVRWKASLVAKENLVSESLRRRCEGLFEKKYGASS